MMTAKEVLKGGSLTSGFDNSSGVRVFHVDGVTSSDSWTDILAVSGVPELGDVHPDGTIYLLTVNVSMIGPETAQINCNYGLPDANSGDANPPQTGTGVIEVGASVSQARTMKDNAGSQITVEHTYNPSTSEEETIVTGMEVDIFIPQHILRETRRESGSPQSAAKTYVGKVNSATIWGYAAHELLCTRISGISNDGGVTYEVTYEFQYNADTWAPLVVFLDKQTGRPPADLVEDDGYKTVDIYQEVSFSSLNLNF